MTATFRLVHFKPNPARGDEFTVGGLVRDVRGTRAYVASHPPGASVLGGGAQERLLSRSLRHLEHHTDFERLSGFGPYFRLGEVREGAEQHCDQLVTSLLQSVGARGPNDTQHEHSQSRHEIAWRWVAHHKLQSLVRRDFRAGVGDAAFLPASPALGRISQYVVGGQDLLLMEPLVARRKVNDDIGKVAQRLATYQLALGKKDRRADLIVYSLDLPKSDLSLVASALEPTEARLVDVSVAREKRQLIERVQEVGSALLLGT